MMREFFLSRLLEDESAERSLESKEVLIVRCQTRQSGDVKDSK